MPILGKEGTEEGKPVEMHQHPLPSLELSIAFSKLLVQEVSDAANREAPHIRRTKTSDLPLLDHVFAEGLYFTLADIVLLPCIHQFLVRQQVKQILSSVYIYIFKNLKVVKYVNLKYIVAFAV